MQNCFAPPNDFSILLIRHPLKLLIKLLSERAVKARQEALVRFNSK
jgi:hypothetical protein